MKRKEQKILSGGENQKRERDGAAGDGGASAARRAATATATAGRILSDANGCDKDGSVLVLRFQILLSQTPRQLRALSTHIQYFPKGRDPGNSSIAIHTTPAFVFCHLRALRSISMTLFFNI